MKVYVTKMLLIGTLSKSQHWSAMDGTSMSGLQAYKAISVSALEAVYLRHPSSITPFWMKDPPPTHLICALFLPKINNRSRKVLQKLQLKLQRS